MSRRRPSRITAFLGALLACLLLAGVAVVAVPTAAAAAPRTGATGLHDGMMPADSPDAVPSSSPKSTGARPNTTRGGATAATLAAPQTGVDVARYQHPNGASIDWNQVRAGGQSFAIVKATELYTDTSTGTGSTVLYTNPYLSGDLAGARAAGLVVGAYAFAHPENSPVTQADDFAVAIGGSLGAGSLPPVLDLEVDGGLTPAQLVSWTQTFLDRLQADTGAVPMIYTGPNFWQSSLGGSTAFGRYPLWEAHYTTAAAPAAIAGWSSYSLWQYTDAGSVPGITGNVDLSRSNGPVASLTTAAAGVPQAGVAAVRTTAGSVLAFVRGTDGALWVTTAINGVFGGFQRIPSGTLSGPAAVTANGRRVDIFVEGTDRGLWHMALTVDSAGRPANLEPWDPLGGTIVGAPAAASSTSGRLLVSARGTDGAIWSRTFSAGGWQPWAYDGGSSVSAAALDVVDADTYRAQIVNPGGAVWTSRISAATGAPLTGWQPMGLTSSLAPGASATAWWATSVRAAAYGLGGGGVQQRWANGRVVNLGGIVTSGLALAELGTSSVWTLARGADNALWLNVSDGTGSTWSKVGGVLA